MPKIKHIRVTDDAAFSPRKYVEMSIDFKGVTITETRASKPRSFSVEQPVGPASNYTRPDDSAIPVTLDQHARRVTELVETNLIHAYHVDHIKSEDGSSPYAGRAKGLVLEKITGSNDSRPSPWDVPAALSSIKNRA